MTFRIRSGFTVSAAIAATGCLANMLGCNTDGLWAEKKIDNAPITRVDAPSGITLPDITVADAGEVDLVEEVLTHRAMYHRTLQLLRDYYRKHGYEDKLRWAESELRGVDRIQPFAYLRNGEVPREDLRPERSIAEADLMYEKGLRLMKEGGHGMPALYREDRMLDALNQFVELIRTHPNSDKIDDAAFMCGEIHKEYLKDQEPIAVRWYERAFAWDPATNHPARFQAAVVYDFRMHDRDRALELYRQVIDVESSNPSNVSFAIARIDELTGADARATSVPPDDMFGQPMAVTEEPMRGN